MPRRDRPSTGPAPLRRCARVGVHAAVAALLLAASAARAQDVPSAAGDAAGELSFIETLYREGDAYRAETEVLRFLHNHPAHPQRDAVELARAKLYYRDGRYRESQLMLYSLLDRFPQGEAARPAFRLLAFTQVRQGNLETAGQNLAALAGSRKPPGGLAELANPPGTVDAERAVRWSTWLPGAGFYLVDEPGKAAAALGLNLAFIGAGVASYRAEATGAALLFLLVEAALYQGQRKATREAAVRWNARLRAERTDAWLAGHGEARLLSVGLEAHFGGG